jgi:hypothetical protein
MGESSKATKASSDTDQSLFAALLDMVSCGGRANACHANVYKLPANEMPSRRFDERDLLDDVFESRVLSCGVRRQNNQDHLQRVLSSERDLLDHIFEGRVLPCGPHSTAKEEQIKRLFSDRRDLLDHIFEGRVFSGTVPFPSSNSPEDRVKRGFSDERDLLGDIFEGRVLSCASPVDSNPDHIKRIFSNERDLLDHIFEGRGLPGNPCSSSDQHNQVKQVFSDQRDLLDDVFEGRIFSGRASEPEKRESVDQRDLLDHIFEGKIFSGSTPKSPTKEKSNEVKGVLDDKQNCLGKIFDSSVFSKHDQASRGTAENITKTSNSAKSRHEGLSSLPEERDCFQILLEDFLCTCQADTDARDYPKIPPTKVTPRNIQEESDLLDDVFEGRLCSDGINHMEVEPVAKNEVPDKDALDHIFENVERNVCGVGSMTQNLSDQGPDVKRNRSLIDDASSVGSRSHVSRRGLWILSPDDRPRRTYPSSHQGEPKKPNIIQSFLSRDSSQ